MPRLLAKLLSPNLWVLIASLLGIGGLACVLIGFLTGIQALTYVGICLFAPLIVGGVLLLTVIIPILIAANRKGGKGTS